jgi:hypothetical protein
VTPDQCYAFINNDKPLFPDVTDDQWAKFSSLAKKANLGDIDTDRIIKEFRKHRIDLLQVVYNHEHGLEWLDKEVSRLRSKLNLT